MICQSLTLQLRYNRVLHFCLIHPLISFATPQIKKNYLAFQVIFLLVHGPAPNDDLDWLGRCHDSLRETPWLEQLIFRLNIPNDHAHMMSAKFVPMTMQLCFLYLLIFGGTFGLCMKSNKPCSAQGKQAMLNNLWHESTLTFIGSIYTYKDTIYINKARAKRRGKWPCTPQLTRYRGGGLESISRVQDMS